MPKLILFDIDGTLLGMDGASSWSLNRAMKELTGISDGFQRVSFAGKTDLQIIREGLKKSGLADQGDLPNSIKNLYLVYLREELSAGKAHLKAGVNELLRTLQKVDGVYLGLLTGNTEEGARLKLEAFGLNHYFPLGAFGSDNEDRNLLLPIALRRLQESEFISLSYENCVVVGDTPRDVECARVHGASSVAVATGPYSMDELQETEASIVVPDLSSKDKIVDWILNSPQ